MEEQKSKENLGGTMNGYKKLAIAGVGLIAILGGYFYFSGSDYTHMAGHHGNNDMAHHGADGTGHDEINMPGLRGEDASEEESAELAVMFRNFEKITRTVTNLPNGIKTISNTEDKELLATLVSHVTGMITRVEEGRDPKVFIQSPTLDILFERREKITTDIETTDIGIVVTQTSDDPEIVKALQTHAEEVSDMAERGMQAVHEAMMKR